MVLVWCTATARLGFFFLFEAASNSVMGIGLSLFQLQICTPSTVRCVCVCSISLNTLITHSAHYQETTIEKGSKRKKSSIHPIPTGIIRSGSFPSRPSFSALHSVLHPSIQSPVRPHGADDSASRARSGAPPPPLWTDGNSTSETRGSKRPRVGTVTDGSKKRRSLLGLGAGGLVVVYS